MQPTGLVGAFNVHILNNSTPRQRHPPRFFVWVPENYSTGRAFYIMINQRATVERAAARVVAALRAKGSPSLSSRFHKDPSCLSFEISKHAWFRLARHRARVYTSPPRPVPPSPVTDSRVLWNECLRILERDVGEREITLWLRPLQARLSDGTFSLQAPNALVADRVRENYLPRLHTVISHVAGQTLDVSVVVGSNEKPPTRVRGQVARRGDEPAAFPIQGSPLNGDYIFANFVEGGCNRIARAAAHTVADNPGNAYNPLFVYGGVGLGKTHLMHAIGQHFLGKDSNRRVAYVHSERFVGDMVVALQSNTMGEFKRRYRSLDMLLIDDIQFFSGKERTQEEFFHTFNTLLEARQQVVLSCDRYPKEVDGLEERLKSRFGWGLTVAIEPPEIETCVAILTTKAERLGLCLPHEVAFFISERIRSNVRELEGALHRVIAHARFTSKPIDIETTKLALHDLLSLQQRLISLDNIQKTVANYYRIRISDINSKNRSRSVARPRQMAMALAKELTHHSLPEIGDAFGGRDHTTVLHASKKIKELRKSDPKVQEDYQNLLRIITG